MPSIESPAPPVALFLHGLDSSSRGTKGQWLRRHFPAVHMHDYQGSLEERLAQLESEVAGQNNLILVGSSFGGLMAACFAINHPHRVRRLVLLAPALNFGGYHPPDTPLSVPTLLVMGQFDTVCPPDLVLPQARATFSSLTVRIEDDDHMLHRTFPTLDWPHLLT